MKTEIEELLEIYVSQDNKDEHIAYNDEIQADADLCGECCSCCRVCCISWS